MNLRILTSLLTLFFITGSLFAQSNNDEILPRGFAPGEKDKLSAYMADASNRNMVCITTPPDNIRTMAEWEEIQGLVITWAAYAPILIEIVRHAKEECEVIIVCQNENSVKNALNGAAVDWSTNVTFIEDEFDSVWVRDYGPNTVYLDDVDELAFVDWIYNRPRPDDDVIPEVVADHLDIPMYCTTNVPNDLVHTGGNFMADGMGKAFSSELVLDENDQTNQWGTSNHSEDDVNQIMSDFMGIDEYIKMTVLPYDAIHHIDMHMKLLDEERLLVGEYPQGVADGPQIEANIQYVLSNFTTSFGTPFEVIRMPMPPDGNDNYPDDVWWADYRTYTNAVFVNKTILVPTYEVQYDTTALRIWRESMPGYTVVGIDCNEIISASGAIHCITKEVGVNEPLQIVHQELEDVSVDIPEGYTVNATIRHKSGINNAQVFYTTDPVDIFPVYNMVGMSLIDATNNTWAANIPSQPSGSTVHYYIDAEANSGKMQSRPIVAPEGTWDFNINVVVNTAELIGNELMMDEIFPNPASAITCIPVKSTYATEAQIVLSDVFGRELQTILNGQLPAGESKYFLDASILAAGTYLVALKTEGNTIVQKLIVK